MTGPAGCGWEIVTSPSWDGPTPAISVTVATWGRAAYLVDVVRALEGQTVRIDDFEVVIVDDASPDETWSTLAALAAGTPLRLLAARLPANRGAAGARNAAVSLGRTPIVAFTDDDCLPAAGWLAGIQGAFQGGADVVQGRTVPLPSDEVGAGPWDHSIWVTGPTPFFETCNVAYRREAVLRVGGFDEADAFINQRRISPFGEDAVLGAKIRGGGGTVCFSEAALVHHRYLAGTYRSHLRRRWQVGEFPGLVRRSQLVDDALWHRLFLSRRTAAFDLALACAITAAVSRRAWVLAGLGPWLRDCWAESSRRPGGRSVVRTGQVAAGDAVAFIALVRGSVRHRRVVL